MSDSVEQLIARLDDGETAMDAIDDACAMLRELEAHREALCKQVARYRRIKALMPDGGVAPSKMQGAERIWRERTRQIVDKGYGQVHDEVHGYDALPVAAACYAMNAAGWKMERGENGEPVMWPFDFGSWRPSSIDRDLEKSGALIAAAIDRVS